MAITHLLRRSRPLPLPPSAKPISSSSKSSSPKEQLPPKTHPFWSRAELPSLHGVVIWTSAVASVINATLAIRKSKERRAHTDQMNEIITKIMNHIMMKEIPTEIKNRGEADKIDGNAHPSASMISVDVGKIIGK